MSGFRSVRHWLVLATALLVVAPATLRACETAPAVDPIAAANRRAAANSKEQRDKTERPRIPLVLTIEDGLLLRPAAPTEGHGAFIPARLTGWRQPGLLALGGGASTLDFDSAFCTVPMGDRWTRPTARIAVKSASSVFALQRWHTGWLCNAPPLGPPAGSRA